MKRSTFFFCLVLASLGWAQTSPQPTPFARARVAERIHVPSYSDVYCAGFITDRHIQSGLYILTGEEGGLKNLYSDRDIVYLNRGAGYIVNPGGEYMLLRPIRDPVHREIFHGQNGLMSDLGQMYAEVGRIRVNIVHPKTVTAQVQNSCMEIQPGDLAIPFNQKPMPQLRPAGTFDRFAPPSGKVLGLIATGKNFQSTLGAGNVVYLSRGASDGVAAGQFYRIYRTFASAIRDPNRRYLQSTPTHLSGMRQSFHLTLEETQGLPRDILGELVILWVEGRSAVGLITLSRAEIFPGDQVELE